MSAYLHEFDQRDRVVSREQSGGSPRNQPRSLGVADKKKPSPSWIDVKAALQAFDRAGLLGLVQDLYAVSDHNQSFLHARLGLGQDQLRPYKATILRWICPDLERDEFRLSSLSS
jgi:hypothetical protein